MAIEYITVWNGAHGGQDGDLLDESLRLPKKVQVDPEPRRRWNHIDLVSDALPSTEAAALTLAEIAAATCLAKQTVNAALYTLRQQGKLRSVVLDHGRAYRSRPPQKYWLSDHNPTASA